MDEPARGARVRWIHQPPGAGGQLELFETPERIVGRGEYRGLEFVHVRARTIINHLGAEARVPFRFHAALDAGAPKVSSVLLHLRPGVRDHYLAALAETHPDLVGGHERLYARGAYAAKTARDRVSAQVRDLVAR